MKPKLFIGSSTESIDYAYAAQSQLDDVAEVTVWTQGVFALTSDYLGSLIKEAGNSDFGLFIFAPDDVSVIRGESFPVVRDNVLFEFGLFMGALEKNRTFFVTPKSQGGSRQPSDLLGIASATFDASRENIAAALGPACFLVRQAIKSSGVRQGRLSLPSVEIVDKPRFLCVTTPQYTHITLEKDIELLKQEVAKLAGAMKEEHGISSSRLREVLLNERFDIIHIRAFTNPQSGDIYFSDIDFKTGNPLSDDPDCMSAEAFSKLIEFGQTHLVILATCDSIVLAAKLARVTNMIGATGWVQIQDFIEWEKPFFKCLTGGMSLYNSYDFAKSLMSRSPMLLIANKDVAFAP